MTDMTPVSRSAPALEPSPKAAAQLCQNARYGTAELLQPGVARILAANPKDYTGPGTNSYLVGEETIWVIDPGPACDRHVMALLDAIDGRQVAGILVTHSHLDHSPAARMLAEHVNATVYGYGALSEDVVALTHEDVDADFEPDRPVSDGSFLGEGEWAVQAVHTPGHFPNHMCYFLPEKQLLFSGDHVMGWSTTSIVPPLGNLQEYLESLDKIHAFGSHQILPSHGHPVCDPSSRLEEIRQHRMLRQQQVEDCLARGISEVAAIVAEIYEDLTPRLIDAAMGCVEAHLEFAGEG